MGLIACSCNKYDTNSISTRTDTLEGFNRRFEQAEETINELLKIKQLKLFSLYFPGGAVVKNLSTNAGDMGLSPGPGRSHMPWSS